MKGKVGTPMMVAGDEAPILPRTNLDALIKARDILKVNKDINDTERAICQFAIDWPIHTSRKQYLVVYAIWVRLAKSGLMRGIRTLKRYPDLPQPVKTP